MLGFKTSDELKRLGKVAFLIAEAFVEEEGYKFYFRIVLREFQDNYKKTYKLY